MSTMGEGNALASEQVCWVQRVNASADKALSLIKRKPDQRHETSKGNQCSSTMTIQQFRVCLLLSLACSPLVAMGSHHGRRRLTGDAYTLLTQQFTDWPGQPNTAGHTAAPAVKQTDKILDGTDAPADR